MKIKKIDKKDILQIRPMWEGLNKLHGKISTYFKDHFHSFSFEVRQKQLEAKECFEVFVAYDQDTNVGYCIASVENDIGEIDSIYVDPKYRNQNIGENLISEAELWLKSNGISKIMIYVAEGNESVFNFYSKQGYYQRFTVLEKKS